MDTWNPILPPMSNKKQRWGNSIQPLTIINYTILFSKNKDQKQYCSIRKYYLSVTETGHSVMSSDNTKRSPLSHPIFHFQPQLIILLLHKTKERVKGRHDLSVPGKWDRPDLPGRWGPGKRGLDVFCIGYVNTLLSWLLASLSVSCTNVNFTR